MRLEGFQMLERLLHDEKLLYSNEDCPKKWARSTFSVDEQIARQRLEQHCTVKRGQMKNSLM